MKDVVLELGCKGFQIWMSLEEKKVSSGSSVRRNGSVKGTRRERTWSSSSNWNDAYVGEQKEIALKRPWSGSGAVA